MAQNQLKANEYINMLEISERKHLLVEGKDDKRLFITLFQKFFGIDWKTSLGLDIDTADSLVEVENVKENREKVEYISRTVVGKGFEARFVGFVDREFRYFEFSEIIEDLFKDHIVLDRLVLSRGHSIENYFFEVPSLIKSLRDLSSNNNIEDSLIQYINIFESIIRIACAVSLTAKEYCALSRIKASLKWQLFEISSSNLSIKLGNWKKVLIESKGYSFDEADKIIICFEKWLRIINASEFENVRWACHGHIGFNIVWNAFACCTYRMLYSDSEIEKQKEASYALKADEEMRFNICSSIWAEHIDTHNHIFPIPVFQLLDIKI